MSTFYKLSVIEIYKETDDSVSIVLEIPEALKDTFRFIPGQYVNVKIELNGAELRRAYSICSASTEKNIRIGIKAIPDGTFSVYATNKLKVGDTLDISAPEGRFILEPQEEVSKTYLAVAAGSGITPILSMISSVIQLEPQSRFVLIYGNKRPSQAMFKDEIDKLASAHSDRFFVHYIYSQENDPDALFGRIDASICNFVIKNKHKETAFDKAFLCGPEEMIHTVKDHLQTIGFVENSVYFELFTAKEEMITSENMEGNATLTVLLDDEETILNMPKEKNILEVALSNGLDAPYSCQGGICSSCLAKVTVGKAVMDKNAILTDKEVAEGLILTCQAHPVTDTITVDYDVV